ncbi:MAG TPA: fatty acid CoA ligase family protein [Fimbriiglobus sp.]|nr:fatty acid CoA ligase family protein [Fimbriiglobus sp.]
MTTPPVNVASHLARMAAAEPTRPALHYPAHRVKPTGPTAHTTLTFAQLHAESDALAHGFAHAGVTRGTRVALMVPPSPDFFALTFALLTAGAVPVLIDPGMGMRNLGRCLAEAEPEAFVGVARAQLARRIFGWARRSVKTTVNVGRRRFFCHFSLKELRHWGATRGRFDGPHVSPTEPAAILFTSGSTGVAKGAVYTHGIFAAQVELLKATYGIEPGEVDLCTFPLFALFGPALGMTCVIPDMDASRPARIDPRKAIAQMRQFGVTNLFGSPAVIRRLGEYRVASLQVPSRKSEDTAPPSDLRLEDLRLATLKRVISAGAPARAKDIERFVTLLPETAEVFTPYGATEALPVSNIGSREILGETRHLTDQGKGVCVGRPVQGMSVYVIPITDEPVKEWDESLCLPVGEVGEFVVRGPVVTRQYYNRPEATKLAKIRDTATGDILHRMGDIGYRDDRGRLWFCGRKSHRVVTPHGTLFTDMVEPVFNTVPGVARTALVGVTRDGVTYPVVCVEREKPDFSVETKPRFVSRAWKDLLPELRAIAARFDHTRAIDTFLEHSHFPVDVRHNSKIFREKLAVWADRKLSKNWDPKALGRQSVGLEGAP